MCRKEKVTYFPRIDWRFEDLRLFRLILSHKCYFFVSAPSIFLYLNYLYTKFERKSWIHRQVAITSFWLLSILLPRPSLNTIQGNLEMVFRDLEQLLRQTTDSCWKIPKIGNEWISNNGYILNLAAYRQFTNASWDWIIHKKKRKSQFHHVWAIPIPISTTKDVICCSYGHIYHFLDYLKLLPFVNANVIHHV